MPSRKRSRDADDVDGEVEFYAETLGCTVEQVDALGDAGFDYLFNSFAWWDLKKPWALEQYERLRVLAPSIAFPENHDMKRLAAEIGGGPEAVAAHLRTRYALAAFFSAGVLMPIGYEWGYRRALHVVETTPCDRENETGIDISASIRAIRASPSAAMPMPVLFMQIICRHSVVQAPSG